MVNVTPRDICKVLGHDAGLFETAALLLESHGVQFVVEGGRWIRAKNIPLYLADPLAYVAKQEGVSRADYVEFLALVKGSQNGLAPVQCHGLTRKRKQCKHPFAWANWPLQYRQLRNLGGFCKAHGA